MDAVECCAKIADAVVKERNNCVTDEIEYPLVDDVEAIRNAIAFREALRGFDITV